LKKLRLFFALWPPRATAEALHAWAAALQRRAGGRATRAEAIHLTLAFLGDVPEEKVPRALAAARQVRAGACELAIEEARFWPHHRIVWVGPSETPAPLAALARDLRTELEREGFAIERRVFAAHVTLLRKARASRTLPVLPALAWPAREFVLVRSTFAAEGSRYQTMERFRLDLNQAAQAP
jgi:2'-5' RNA ligase